MHPQKTDYNYTNKLRLTRDENYGHMGLTIKFESYLPNPLEDYEQAMELIRSRAEEWNLYPDKVAVIGFSAGGHLAACAATMARNKPNAAILGYAVTEGEIAQECEKSAPDVVSRVDKNTCPCFLFATRTDQVVPISNSTNFINALVRHGVMFESHIYAYGPHGFSVGNAAVLKPGTKICSCAPHWAADSIEWLGDMFGNFGSGEFTEPECGRTLNGDREDFLSVDCTMGHLMTNEQAREILIPMLETAAGKAAEMHIERIPEQKNSWEAIVSGMGARMTLRDTLGFTGASEEAIQQLDAKLRTIIN